jgi:hypothetical protein
MTPPQPPARLASAALAPPFGGHFGGFMATTLHFSITPGFRHRHSADDVADAATDLLRFILDGVEVI